MKYNVTFKAIAPDGREGLNGWLTIEAENHELAGKTVQEWVAAREPTFVTTVTKVERHTAYNAE